MTDEDIRGAIKDGMTLIVALAKEVRRLTPGDERALYILRLEAEVEKYKTLCKVKDGQLGRQKEKYKRLGQQMVWTSRSSHKRRTTVHWLGKRYKEYRNLLAVLATMAKPTDEYGSFAIRTQIRRLVESHVSLIVADGGSLDERDIAPEEGSNDSGLERDNKEG